MEHPETVIIFVPGIRPKPPVELHGAELRRCLARGLERLGTEPATAAEIAGALRIIGWSWYFYGIHKDIELDRAGIERLLSQQDDPLTVAREATSFSRQFGKLLYWLADRFPRLVGIFATNAMETRVHEVRRYFDNRHAEADAIRMMLVKELRKAWQREQQVIVLAHSFGSVIAYDALWELTHNAEESGNVDWFITMGSPLTMEFMRRRIRGAELDGAMRYPANIRRWFNFAALGEVTALDRRLADCFRGMLELRLVEMLVDDLTILNEYREPDGLNVHKCYGYLANQTIAALIREAWYRRRD